MIPEKSFDRAVLFGLIVLQALPLFQLLPQRGGLVPARQLRPGFLPD
jgi:hypothetical protein